MAKKIKAEEAQALGIRLHRARQSQHDSLQECAEKCGVDASQICRFEKGDFRTLSPNVIKLCRLLQISPEALVIETVETIAAKAVKIAQTSPAKLRFISLMLDALEVQFGHHP